MPPIKPPTTPPGAGRSRKTWPPCAPGSGNGARRGSALRWSRPWGRCMRAISRWCGRDGPRPTGSSSRSSSTPPPVRPPARISRALTAHLPKPIARRWRRARTWFLRHRRRQCIRRVSSSMISLEGPATAGLEDAFRPGHFAGSPPSSPSCCCNAAPISRCSARGLPAIEGDHAHGRGSLHARHILAARRCARPTASPCPRATAISPPMSARARRSCMRPMQRCAKAIVAGDESLPPSSPAKGQPSYRRVSPSITSPCVMPNRSESPTRPAPRRLLAAAKTRCDAADRQYRGIAHQIRRNGEHCRSGGGPPVHAAGMR